MKSLLRIVLLLCVISFVAACAPKPMVGENSSPVVFQFKSVDDISVLTFWRKIEADGTKGKRFSVGGGSQFSLFMNFSFPDYSPETVQLEPGTYYLDSYQVSTGGGTYCISEGGHFSTRNGWDDANNEPIFLSFTLERGNGLVLPEVVFNGCSAKINDHKNIYTLGKEFRKM